MILPATRDLPGRLFIPGWLVTNVVTFDLFDRLFDETIDLIEQTVDYLEASGKSDRASLPGSLLIPYTTETMRLSTQLMQSMAWLMVQKAVRMGELDLSEAGTPKHRLGARRVCEDPGPDLARLLPERFVVLAERGRGLYARLGRLDRFVFGPTDPLASSDQPRLQDAPSLGSGMVLPHTANTICSLRAERARLRHQRA